MITVENSVPIIKAILRIVKKMPKKSSVLWQNRIDYEYGDLQGQRSVNIDGLKDVIGTNDLDYNATELIISLETYYYLTCNFIALSSLYNDPVNFSEKVTKEKDKYKISFLEKLASGKSFTDFEIYGLEYAYDFDWITSTRELKNIIQIVDELCKLSKYWNDNIFLINGSDPFQVIHHSIFPKNLLHITGRFYSPEWLADLLINDIQWTGRGNLLDPFCGSGVFLIKAIEKAINNGFSIDKILKKIIGIDINPIACASARTNIVYNIGTRKYKFTKRLNINIICADSILPSISKYDQNNLFESNIEIVIDNKDIVIPDTKDINIKSEIIGNLHKYGLNLSNWSNCYIKKINSELSLFDKRKNEQSFLFFINQADFIVTNPPWIGWEYISKKYKMSIEKIWLVYDLFKSKGLEAAFLKEDLSNLALLSSWDNYLKQDGKSIVVIRPATMQSTYTSKGLRRLKLSDNGIDLKLEKIRLFTKFNVFEEALTETATWQITKNHKTVFPIRVIDWVKETKKWNPKSFDSLQSVIENIKIEEKVANISICNDKESRWYITNKSQINNIKKIQGENKYIPRMGVFTGGANAVFYLNILKKNKKYSLCENITDRAKVIVPKINVELENACIYDIVCGRNIQMWQSNIENNILCTHNIATKMYPIEEKYLENNFPKTYNYLMSMKNILSNRKGFAGWEKNILKKYFYTLQRIGEYTFSPYKVCWKYIANEFITCVLENENNKTILPNDKVMFIPLLSKEEAYYVCGILSSKLIRNYINSLISKRQISTSVIQSVSIPNFDPNNIFHINISKLCYKGHHYVSSDKHNLLQSTKEQLDEAVNEMYYK